MLRSVISTLSVWKALRITAFILAVGVIGVLLTGQIAHGEGAGGSGGGGDGGGGGAQAVYGYGWYRFSTTDNTLWPERFRNSQTYNGQPLSWPGAAAVCKGLGADSIIAFVVNTDDYYRNVAPSPKYLRNNSRVYDFIGWNNANNYFNRGASSGNYLSINDARASFNNSGLTGLTWGKNVAWFCYDFKPKDYNLVPTATANPTGVVEHGTSVSFSFSVEKTGVDSRNTAVAVKQYVIPPGGTFNQNVGMLDGVTTNNDPRYDSGSVSAETLYQGNRVFTSATTTLSDLPSAAKTLDTGNYTAGTLVCRILALDPPTQNDSPRGRWGAPACIRIGKRPTVQVRGGDLYAGRPIAGLVVPTLASNIQTGTSVRNVSGASRTWGSWVEYGALANGTITGFGTGSSFAGDGLVGATRCNTSPLTFTNGTNGNCANNANFGGYATNQSIPDVAKSFPTNGATSLGANRTVSLTTYRGTYTASGNLTITASNITRGRSVIIVAPTATVTIEGDIRYNNSTLRSIGDIPQVVIIARNINIRANVNQIDAWLIAKATTAGAGGEINTCSNVAKTANLALEPCNRPLTVNGPVMANKLYLRRTSGQGERGPAEIFNLRPDAYLWAYARASASARVQTVYSTEMPPRL